MRVTIVVSSLSKGGAERVAALLANGLYRRAHDVTVVTKPRGEPDDYPLDRGVERAQLAPEKAAHMYSFHRFGAAKQRSANLRKTIVASCPDLVIAFTTKMAVRTLIALKHEKVPVIVSERNNPQLSRLSPLWRLARRTTYPHAKRLISLSHGVDDAFKWLPPAKRSVIHNPVSNAVVLRGGEVPALILDVNKYWLLGCGRLVHQKGFDLLLESFANIAVEFPDWNLVILGEGEDRVKLESLVSKLGLGSRVLMPGRLENPFPVMKQSSLFVLSSRYEGFGNVLLEAMVLGIPVVAFDCKYGPSEIITSDSEGVLVADKDVEGLTQAVTELARQPERRNELAKVARTRAEAFSFEAIIAQWDDQIRRVVEESNV